MARRQLPLFQARRERELFFAHVIREIPCLSFPRRGTLILGPLISGPSFPVRLTASRPSAFPLHSPRCHTVVAFRARTNRNFARTASALHPRGGDHLEFDGVGLPNLAKVLQRAARASAFGSRPC